jgi:hypothetical protein
MQCETVLLILWNTIFNLDLNYFFKINTTHDVTNLPLCLLNRWTNVVYENKYLYLPIFSYLNYQLNGIEGLDHL